MAAHQLALLLAVVCLLGAVQVQGSCSTSLDACYSTYSFAKNLASDDSCIPYKALKACVNGLTSISSCTDSDVNSHVNIMAAYAANASCNSASLTEASFICFLIVAVISLLVTA